MELTQQDMIQFFYELSVPKEIMERCKGMMEQEKYQEIYNCLRCVRCDYLDDLHESQKRIDQLDYLIYQIKMKHEKEKEINESRRT